MICIDGVDTHQKGEGIDSEIVFPLKIWKERFSTRFLCRIENFPLPIFHFLPSTLPQCPTLSTATLQNVQSITLRHQQKSCVCIYSECLNCVCVCVCVKLMFEVVRKTASQKTAYVHKSAARIDMIRHKCEQFPEKTLG